MLTWDTVHQKPECREGSACTSCEPETCARCGGRLCAECLFDHCPRCDDRADGPISVTVLSH